MTNSFKIIQINIRSIKNKQLDLKCMISEKDPDIICINETFLNGNATLKIDGYSTYNLNRPSNGGGVILLVKETIKHNNIKKINIEGHEIIQCQIFPNQTNKFFTINAIYFPPQRKINL